MPSKLSVAGKSFGKFGFLGLGAVFKFLLKHWYLAVIAIIILPSVISSISMAIETKNPIHPALELGKRIFTADNVIGEDIELLKEQGVSSFVGMEKPTEGIWQQTKYHWFFFWRVIFRFLGNVWLITVPLLLIYKVIRYRNISEINKNITYSFFIFIFYLFVVNILFVMYQLVTGEIQIILPEGAGEFKQIWSLFLHLLPLHGLGSLATYLITSVNNP